LIIHLGASNLTCIVFFFSLSLALPLSLSYTLVYMIPPFVLRQIIGCGGIDPNAPRVVPAMDQLASGCAAMYTRRNAGTAYKKWRAHELIAQKRYPNLMADMGSTPVTIEIVPAPMPVNASKT
jgi:hypothetical protein